MIYVSLKFEMEFMKLIDLLSSLILALLFLFGESDEQRLSRITR